MPDEAVLDSGLRKVVFLDKGVAVLPPPKSNSAAKHVKDGLYETPVKLGMAGSWEIDVSVQRPGQKPVQAKLIFTAQ